MNLSDTVRKLAKDIAELTKLVMNIRAVSGGGITTGQNIGVGGVGVYHSVVANTMRFRTVNAASAQITVALDAVNNEVDIELGPHVHQAAGSGSQLDHGLALTGLLDDDHTQYLLAAGTRALSANWDAGAAAGRIIQVGYLVAGGAVAAVEYLQSEGRLALKETTAPGGGTANYGILYVKSADSVLYFMDDAGVEYDLLAGGGGGAPADAEYIVGTASGLLSAERVKAAIYDNYDLDDYPAAPDALDDEFDDGAIDVKWSFANEPVAYPFNETDFPGFIWVGMPENAADNYDSYIQLYQTAPSGTQTMEFIAKVSLGGKDWGSSSSWVQYANITLCLINSTNKEWVGVTIQISYSSSIGGSIYASMNSGTAFATYSGGVSKLMELTQFVYLKLVKAEANAYTAANIYNMYYSLNGIIWMQLSNGTGTKTFTSICDRVGFIFRTPATQAGDPVGLALVDFFRRIA